MSYKDHKIDFVVAGTQKGGTTALRSYLRDHPEICISNQDEAHFFDNEDVFQDMPVNYALYHSYFTPLPKHKVLGDVTPIYMYWNPSMKRIYDYNSAMKIIVILRNPIERAHSHWNMERDRGYETLSFWNAIKKEKARCQEALPLQHRIFSYVNRGFYMEQLYRMWNYFPQDQTLILKNSDLLTDPANLLNKVCSFLRISYYKNDVKMKRIHARPYKSRLAYKEWKYLKDVYSSDISELGQTLGWDCKEWLNYDHYRNAVGDCHATSNIPGKDMILKRMVSFFFDVKQKYL